MEPDKQQVDVDYAEHKEFFDKYHLYRDNYLEYHSVCLFEDLKQLPQALKYLNKYIKSVSAQISLIAQKDEIKQKQNELIRLYQAKKYHELLESMDLLYDQVEEYCMQERLIPRPEIEEKDPIHTEKDDKIRYALEAYKLIYGE